MKNSDVEQNLNLFLAKKRLTYLSGAAGSGLSSKVHSIRGDGTPVAAHLMTILWPILVTAPLNVDTSRGGLSENRIKINVCTDCVVLN